ENLNLNLKDDEEEEKEEEDVRSPDSFEFNNDDEEYDELYKDVNVRLTVIEHEEVRKGDAEMTVTTHESASHEKFLNLDNVPPIIDEVASMMNVKTPHEELSTQAPPNLSVPVTATLIASTIHEISNFATPVIQSTITESLENVVLAKSSSQPQSTYETAASLTKFELKKILLDKLEKSHEDKDKDEDPPAGPDQWLKKRKTSKDVEPSRGSKSKESKSSSSKGFKSQSKSSGKSAQAEKPVPPTPDRNWNAGKQIDFRPPQTWISNMAKTGKPPTTFDELMSTPIDFSAYVLHNLKIENLTQERLVGPDFNLLKGTCKSRVELIFHFEECYKAVTDKLNWHNPEGHEYPFDLIKPLPLIKDQGRQVVHANYFFNNDLEYLKGGSSSRKYTTSTTKTKAAKYDNIEGIEDMVQTLWSPVKLYKFKEGDFPRLNLHDIEDMLLLLVQKNLSNLERDDLFYLNMALRIFTRRVVILKRVEDLQLVQVKKVLRPRKGFKWF
ncbi:hypothetical protein Tco_1165689, partial [Tanacetum coccineum]